MTVQEQHHGGYIDINPGYESPKYGDETTSCYLLDPRIRLVPRAAARRHVSFSSPSSSGSAGCFFGC